MAGYNVALACGMDGWMNDGWLPNGQIQWAKEMEKTAALFNVWSQCRWSFRFADVKEP